MKAMIGMSGGVDSSVAAYLAQQDGYTCIGVTLRLYGGNEAEISDAQKIAAQLGMAFQVQDCSQAFREKVMDYFVQSYRTGLTPNPCVVCNRYLKFGVFLDNALSQDCESVVTGHYARICQLANGRYCLRKAVDEPKDQTYFLCNLSQHQLSHIHFPLGHLTKAEVRRIAQEQGFLNARKRDSQDICFVPDGDYMAFLQRYTGEESVSGSFLDEHGNVVGTHRGAAAYTLGQRKGLGLAMGQPVYVCGKDMAANTVTVGPNEALFRRSLIASDANWMAFDAPDGPIRCKAKARSRMAEQPATVYPMENGLLRVEFDEPQRAITPGQAIVFYDGDLVLGGATITEVL